MTITQQDFDTFTSLSLGLYILIGNLFFIIAFVIVMSDIAHMFISSMRVRNADTKAKMENAGSRAFLALLKQQANEQLDIIKKNDAVHSKLNKNKLPELRPCSCSVCCPSGERASDGLNKSMLELGAKLMQAERERQEQSAASSTEKNQEKKCCIRVHIPGGDEVTCNSCGHKHNCPNC